MTPEKSINKAERPVCGCGAETETNDLAHHPDCPRAKTEQKSVQKLADGLRERSRSRTDELWIAAAKLLEMEGLLRTIGGAIRRREFGGTGGFKYADKIDACLSAPSEGGE